MRSPVARRALLSTAAAAVPVLAVPAVVSAAGAPATAEVDPHLAWMDERARLRLEIDAMPDGDEPEARVEAELIPLEDRILRTPTRTLAGAHAQLAVAAAVSLGRPGEDHPEEAGLRNALATLDRVLGGEARS